MNDGKRSAMIRNYGSVFARVQDLSAIRPSVARHDGLVTRWGPTLLNPPPIKRLALYSHGLLIQWHPGAC